MQGETSSLWKMANVGISLTLKHFLPWFQVFPSYLVQLTTDVLFAKAQGQSITQGQKLKILFNSSLVHYQRPTHQPAGSQQFLVQMYLWFVIGYGFPSMSLRVQTISCSASLNYKCLMWGDSLHCLWCSSCHINVLSRLRILQ